MNSRARQLCYPRSNFSVISRPHQGAHRGSLDQTFVFGFLLVRNPIRLTFALALYTGFLTRLSQPLGTHDILSTVCHPSQTVHLPLSSFLSEQRKLWRVVLHYCLFAILGLRHDDSHLRYTTELTSQQQDTVKFHGVFASHWKSLVFAPVKSVQGAPSRDSGDLVTPFMRVVIQTTRYFATLREL
jgi:hypothetical protein